MGLHLVPLGLHILASQVGVGVDGGPGNIVLLGKGLAVVDERNDGRELLVSLAQGGLELRVSINQATDLLQGVDNEHVYKILTSSVKPVVERSGSLGKLQMKRVDAFKNLLRLVHAVSPLLGQCSKSVPLVTDLLAPGVDGSAVPVVQSVQLLGDGSYLLNSVLVGGQVRLKSFVLLLHRLQLKDLAVLGRQHFLLAAGPSLVNVSLVLEFLSKML